jgi:M-phase phosphoprotein 6
MPSAKGNTTAKSGVKRPRSNNTGNDADTKAKLAKLSPATHTTQLSGATRNMRFMQRGKITNSTTSRHSYPPHQHKSSAIIATETDKVEFTNKTSAGNDNSIRSTDLSNETVDASGDGMRENVSVLPNVSSVAVNWERATPLDMFGENACILLGRRSYNGFNATTASNLHMQQQHLEYEEKLKQRRNTTNSATDRRIYRELSKKVQNDEKQAFTNGGKLSKKKKRTLDDILKLVDA